MADTKVHSSADADVKPHSSADADVKTSNLTYFDLINVDIAESIICKLDPISLLMFSRISVCKNNSLCEFDRMILKIDQHALRTASRIQFANKPTSKEIFKRIIDGGINSSIQSYSLPYIYAASFTLRSQTLQLFARLNLKRFYLNLTRCNLLEKFKYDKQDYIRFLAKNAITEHIDVNDMENYDDFISPYCLSLKHARKFATFRGITGISQQDIDLQLIEHAEGFTEHAAKIANKNTIFANEIVNLNREKQNIKNMQTCHTTQVQLGRDLGEEITEGITEKTSEDGDPEVYFDESIEIIVGGESLDDNPNDHLRTVELCKKICRTKNYRHARQFLKQSIHNFSNTIFCWKLIKFLFEENPIRAESITICNNFLNIVTYGPAIPFTSYFICDITGFEVIYDSPAEIARICRLAGVSNFQINVSVFDYPKIFEQIAKEGEILAPILVAGSRTILSKDLLKNLHANFQNDFVKKLIPSMNAILRVRLNEFMNFPDIYTVPTMPLANNTKGVQIHKFLAISLPKSADAELLAKFGIKISTCFMKSIIKASAKEAAAILEETILSSQNISKFSSKDLYKLLSVLFKFGFRYFSSRIYCTVVAKIGATINSKIAKYQEQYFDFERAIENGDEFIFESPLKNEQNAARIKLAIAKFKLRFGRKGPEISASNVGGRQFMLKPNNMAGIDIWQVRGEKWIKYAPAYKFAIKYAGKSMDKFLRKFAQIYEPSKKAIFYRLRHDTKTVEFFGEDEQIETLHKKLNLHVDIQKQ